MPIPGGEKSIGNDVPTDPVKRGFYLATLGALHGMPFAQARRHAGFRQFLGQGRPRDEGTVRLGHRANISSHKEKGVGAWTDDELKRALTEGKGRDGRAFKPPMVRHVYFSKMTDQDINAIIAWMRTIPPVE